MNRHFKYLSFLFLLIISIQAGHARIQVYPLRVFLDQRQQGQEVTVRNLGNTAGSYRINTVLFMQDEEGRMRIADDSEEYDKNLSNHVRFSPRVVQLGPGESQTVRLFVRNVSALSEGDYRTHLRFEQTLESFQESLAEEAELSGNEIRTGLDARVAVSIPVYFRRGNPVYDLDLHDLELNLNREDLNQSQFSVSMTNGGNAFAYGSLYLYVVDPQGEKRQIGFVRGAQSFTPKRKFTYPISNIQDFESLVTSEGEKTFVLEFHSTRDNEEDVVISTSVQI